jgi:hypothetical protein
LLEYAHPKIVIRWESFPVSLLSMAITQSPRHVSVGLWDCHLRDPSSALLSLWPLSVALGTVQIPGGETERSVDFWARSLLLEQAYTRKLPYDSASSCMTR